MPHETYRSLADLPDTIPVFPLSGVLLFPRWSLPLNIFEPRYLNMVDDAMSMAVNIRGTPIDAVGMASQSYTVLQAVIECV